MTIAIRPSNVNGNRTAKNASRRVGGSEVGSESLPIINPR
jgi:hypothetical protein